MIEFTVSECKQVAANHAMDPYHRDCINFLIKKLENAERHMEALLMTLRASDHYWIKKVYKNAQAGWDTNYKGNK